MMLLLGFAIGFVAGIMVAATKRHHDEWKNVSFGTLNRRRRLG